MKTKKDYIITAPLWDKCVDYKRKLAELDLIIEANDEQEAWLIGQKRMLKDHDQKLSMAESSIRTYRSIL